MITKSEIKTIVELFISWNGEKEPIDTANIDSAVDYIHDCLDSNYCSIFTSNE